MRKGNSYKRGLQHGGAALEYVLVSTFAAAVCTAALTFLGKSLEEKLQKLAETLGTELTSPLEIDWLSSDGSP